MRPKKPLTTREGDLFRARLDQIINMKHELVELAGRLDWQHLDEEIAPLYSDKGRPGIASRFVIGLMLLKHIFALSDEEVCERWVYDPYFQYFTGQEFFQHRFPHERSDLSHWHTRQGHCARRTSSGSRSTPPCSPRPSPSRPMPSCCMRRSGASTGWSRSMACGCGSPTCAWPSAPP